MKPRMKLTEHHSISDWDWQHGAQYRGLSSLYYISPPTSLCMSKTTAGSVVGTILSRIAEVQVVPQGELRTWFRSPYPCSAPFNFRNQKPLGGADFQNCYATNYEIAKIVLMRIVGGVGYTIGNFVGSFPTNTWLHLRIIFWNGVNPAGEQALNAELYKEVDSAWVKQGDTLFDTANQWKDSSINRLGLRYQIDPAMPNYFDDTEIWTPV